MKEIIIKLLDQMDSDSKAIVSCVGVVALAFMFLIGCITFYNVVGEFTPPQKEWCQRLYGTDKK